MAQEQQADPNHCKAILWQVTLIFCSYIITGKNFLLALHYVIFPLIYGCFCILRLRKLAVLRDLGMAMAFSQLEGKCYVLRRKKDNLIAVHN